MLKKAYYAPKSHYFLKAEMGNIIFPCRRLKKSITLDDDDGGDTNKEISLPKTECSNSSLHLPHSDLTTGSCTEKEIKKKNCKSSAAVSNLSARVVEKYTRPSTILHSSSSSRRDSRREQQRPKSPAQDTTRPSSSSREKVKRMNNPSQKSNQHILKNDDHHSSDEPQGTSIIQTRCLGNNDNDDSPSMQPSLAVMRDCPPDPNFQLEAIARSDGVYCSSLHSNNLQIIEPGTPTVTVSSSSPQPPIQPPFASLWLPLSSTLRRPFLFGGGPKNESKTSPDQSNSPKTNISSCLSVHQQPLPEQTNTTALQNNPSPGFTTQPNNVSWLNDHQLQHQLQFQQQLYHQQQRQFEKHVMMLPQRMPSLSNPMASSSTTATTPIYPESAMQEIASAINTPPHESSYATNPVNCIGNLEEYNKAVESMFQSVTKQTGCPQMNSFTSTTTESHDDSSKENIPPSSDNNMASQQSNPKTSMHSTPSPTAVTATNSKNNSSGGRQSRATRRLRGGTRQTRQSFRKGKGGGVNKKQRAAQQAPPSPLNPISSNLRRNSHSATNGPNQRDASPPPSVRIIDDIKVTMIDEKLKIFVIDLLTSDTCDLIRKMTDDHVRSIHESGNNVATWRTLYTYTKQDLPCSEVKDLTANVTYHMMNKIIKIVGEVFDQQEEAAKLRPRSWKEPHLLLYQKLDGKPVHTGVEMHYDGCDITWNAMLSKSSEYSGGGTYIRAIQKTVRLEQGQVLIHPGELYHKGVDITEGVRGLIVCFMDGFDPHIIDSSLPKDDKHEYEKNVRMY